MSESKKKLPFCPILVPAYMGMHPLTRRCLTEYTNNTDAVIVEKNFGSNICALRNEFAQEVLSSWPGPPGLFWLDGDQIFQSQDMIQLLEDFKELDQMVSGIYVSRLTPHYPTSFKWLEYGKTMVKMGREDILKEPRGLIEVGAVGFGFVITPRRIFERMSFPWFEQPKESGNTGEDVNFCVRAQLELGEKIWIDTRVRIGHIGEKVYTVEDAESPPDESQSGKALERIN